MSLITTLSPILPLMPLLLTTTIVVNDVNELMTFSTLLHPSHRRAVAQILPSFIPVLVQKSTYFHLPLHLATTTSIGLCMYRSVAPQVSSWWRVALALELSHWIFVPLAISHIKAFEEETSKDRDEKLVGAVQGLYGVQLWRMLLVNIPGWVCCWAPVLSLLGM